MAGIETKIEPGILHVHLPGLVEALEWFSVGIELLAILVMLIGTARFAAHFLMGEISPTESRIPLLNSARIELGRYLLVGLEVFIVSDLIHTALSLDIYDLIFLAILVAIRSMVSFFLDREIRGLHEKHL